MRFLFAGAAVLAAAALVLVLVDGSSDTRASCPAAGYSPGSTDFDGVFFSVVDRTCVDRRGASCEVHDGRGPIARETVDAGIDQDCVVYNQFVGTGVASGSGRYLGECGGGANADARTRLDVRRGAPGDCPSGAAGALPERRPRPTDVRIAGRARDPFGRPPAARQGNGPGLRAPPWQLLVWRRGALHCYEPGQVIDARRFRDFAAVYEGGKQGEGLHGRLLGSLRPDAKFGVGRQFFDFGRFLPYPIEEGGSCGRFGDAGLLLSRTVLHGRPDLGEPRTIVAGIAGPQVRTVEFGSRVIAAAPGTAFVAVVRGERTPEETPVRVRYEDGRVRDFPSGGASAAAGPLIVYWSDSPWPTIWGVRPNGSGAHRILPGRQNAKRPRLSPDRRWIAFDGAPPGKPPLSDFDIQIVRPDGTGRRTLTDSADWDVDAQWSPDGERLSFTRMPPHPSGSVCRCWVWTVGAEGGVAKRLARGEGARWSPDGRAIALDSRRDLFVMDADGSHRRRLTSTKASEFAADWSPDGKKILFTRSPRAEDHTVFVMHADGSHVKKLAKGIAASWSPNGERILYSSGFSAPLKVMNADGSGRHTIATSPASDPDWG